MDSGDTKDRPAGPAGDPAPRVGKRGSDADADADADADVELGEVDKLFADNGLWDSIG